MSGEIDFTTLHALGEIDLSIPAWQMAFFVGMLSILMLFGRIQLALVVTYLFVLYWGFVLYWPHFISVAGEDLMALALYLFSGLAVAFLALLAFFYPS